MSVQAKTYGICGIAMGLVFVALGLYAKKQKEIMDGMGKAVPGLITGARVSKSGKGKKSYVLDISWDQDGEKRTRGFSVKEKYFESKTQPPDKLIATDAVVQYLPGQPDSAIVQGGTSDLGGMQYLGYVFLAGGAIITYRAFQKKEAAPPATA